MVSSRCWTALSLLALVAGCSTVVSVNEFTDYINDRKALRLAVQICIPDRTAYFESLEVDVTDMPVSIRRDELGKMFRDAEASKKYDNPYRSTSSKRELQAIQQWRPSTSNTDFPKKFIGFGKVANVKGIVSDSGETASLVGSTKRNQPIFFAFSHERPSDVIAIHASFQTNRNGISERTTYWFKPPKEIGASGYTEWMSPLSEERPNEKAAKLPIFWLLTHGKEMPIYAVGDNAPRIRYTLFSSEQYWSSLNVGRRAIDLTKLQRLTSSTPVDEELFHLMPAKLGAIPPC